MAGSPDTYNFLKMEDLHADSSPSALFDNSRSSSDTPAPERIVVTSKAAKKRKSWGQELPQPKTSLPPRKRAKTEDEKEQRRIERIKRNRAAAHNSRERKRQETETYAVALARAQAELSAYRKHFGMLPASVVLPEVTLATIPDDAPTPVPSLIDCRSVSAPSPASPALVDDLFEPTQVVIKQEPDLSSQSTIAVPPFEYSDLSTKSATPALSLLDSTQHPAVSVEAAQQPEQQQQQSYDSMVDGFLPSDYDPFAPEYLQDPTFGAMEPFAFTHGADDPSLAESLNFSFDDYIHDPASTVALDSGIGAA